MTEPERLSCNRWIHSLTSESIDGAIFDLHEGVKRSATADLSIWVRGHGGGCCGRNCGHLGCCAGRDGVLQCVGVWVCRTCRRDVRDSQSGRSGHFQRGLGAFLRSGIEVRRLCRPQLIACWTTCGLRRALRLPIVIIVFSKLKCVSASWGGVREMSTSIFDLWVLNRMNEPMSREVSYSSYCRWIQSQSSSFCSTCTWSHTGTSSGCQSHFRSGPNMTLEIKQHASVIPSLRCLYLRTKFISSFG